MNNVLVFKTNIQTKDDHDKVKALLDQHNGIEEWSVDTEDIDCVLRIVSETISSMQIIEQVTAIGYACSELE